MQTCSFVVPSQNGSIPDTVFQLLKSEAVEQLNCDKLTLTFNDLSDYYRHFCSDAEIAAHCD